MFFWRLGFPFSQHTYMVTFSFNLLAIVCVIAIFFFIIDLPNVKGPRAPSQNAKKSLWYLQDKNSGSSNCQRNNSYARVVNVPNPHLKIELEKDHNYKKSQPAITYWSYVSPFLKSKAFVEIQPVNNLELAQTQYWIGTLYLDTPRKIIQPSH